MADNRKNDYSVLLTIPGKASKKIELFSAEKFKDCPGVNKDKPTISGSPDKQYRIRIDGKWYPSGERKFFYRREVIALLTNEFDF